MAAGQLNMVFRQLTGGRGIAEPTDAELLERFATRQDHGAFAALVRLHGPMVLDVCRRVLGNATDAEDAFQATFLILVRKAAALRERCAVLGGWLHEVAYNTALRARAKRSSRHLHEQKAAPRRRSDFIAAVVWRDLQPVLDEEVGRLPRRYRAPFVLCYLEGKTYA